MKKLSKGVHATSACIAVMLLGISAATHASALERHETQRSMGASSSGVSSAAGTPVYYQGNGGSAGAPRGSGGFADCMSTSAGNYTHGTVSAAGRGVGAWQGRPDGDPAPYIGSYSIYGSLRLHSRVPDGLVEASYIQHPDDPDDLLVTAGAAGFAIGEITSNIKKDDDKASGDDKGNQTTKRASGGGDLGNRSAFSIRFPGLGEAAGPMVKELTAFIASRYFPGDYHGGTDTDFSDINLNDLDWPELYFSTAVLAEAKGSLLGKEGVASVGASEGAWRAFGMKLSGMDCAFGWSTLIVQAMNAYLSPSMNYIADVARTVGDTIWTTLKGPDHWGSARH